MPYTPKYTTLKSLMFKAANRLKINDETDTNIFTSTSIATQKIDDELVLSIIEEEENFLDHYLSLVYVMPLVNTHPILRKCIDGLVIGELLEIFYPYAGLDANLQQQNSMKVESLQIIRSITYSLNVHIPGMPLQASPLDRFHIQPIKLLGEVYKTTGIEEDEIPMYRSTFTGKKTQAEEEIENNCFDIEDIYKNVGTQIFIK